MDDFRDRRKHQRKKILLVIKFDEGDEQVEDYSWDASLGGVFIATKRSFSIGEQVFFQVSFPGKLDPVNCKGLVRWIRTAEQSTDKLPAGIGLRFIFDSEEQEARMLGLLEKLAFKAEVSEPYDREQKTYRVLLVEDDLVVLEMYGLALEQFQNLGSLGNCRLEISKAINGLEAWDWLQRESFDLALIDHQLPKLKGAELVKRIREDPSLRSLPVVMLSVGGEAVRKIAHRVGADVFLEKPGPLSALLESVIKLLDLETKDLH